MRNQEEIEEHLNKLLDQSERDIDKVFANRLKDLLDLLSKMFREYGEDGRISRSKIYAYNRFEKEMELIKEHLHEDYQNLYREINRMLKEQYKENVLRSIYVYEMTTLQEFGYQIPSAETIQTAIEHEIPELRLPKLLQTNRNETTRKINIAIASGIQAGEDYSTLAKRIDEILGVSDGKGASYRARRIARTESGRVQVKARLKAGEVAQEHANLEKRWLATLDANTRHDHRDLDGDKADDNGLFHVDGMSAPGPSLFVGPTATQQNINCRCDVAYWVNGQEPEVRRARDYNDADYQRRLADRMDYLMAEEGLTESGARKRAKREVFPPSQVIKWQNYQDWYKDQPRE